MGRPAPDHRADRGERGRLPPGLDALHAEPVQADSDELVAALRVVFRLGAGDAVPASADGAASPAAAVDALLVARRFGAGAVAASVPLAVAAGLRVERRFGAAASPVASAALDAADAVVLRGARRFGAAFSAAGSTASAAGDSVATVSAGPPTTSDDADLVGRDGSVAGLTFWPTWARSTASSSGGTSLHGSFDDVGRGAASRGRSSRRP